MAVTLTVRFSGPESEIEMEAYALRAEVIAVVGMPAELFVMQKRVPSATDAQRNQLGDEFVRLAHPLDFDQIPAGAPTDAVPYYRVTSIDLVFTSLAELEETKGLMDAQFKALVAAVKATENLVVQEEVTYD